MYSLNLITTTKAAKVAPLGTQYLSGHHHQNPLITHARESGEFRIRPCKCIHSVSVLEQCRSLLKYILYNIARVSCLKSNRVVDFLLHIAPAPKCFNV